jgi:2-polyprenyl-3-methyl-5-hydroxy-6-metoxy-1,4-benzoquinol methylase
MPLSSSPQSSPEHFNSDNTSILEEVAPVQGIIEVLPFDRRVRSLFLTINKWPTPDQFKSMKVLDLGCGSDIPFGRLGISMVFPPIFCRQMHQLGAKTVGVDVRPPNTSSVEHEPWQFHQAYLYNGSELTMFEQFEFDIVHTDAFLPFGEYPHPGVNVDEIGIIKRAFELLKIGGILKIDDNMYKKIYCHDTESFVAEIIQGKPLPI